MKGSFASLTSGIRCASSDIRETSWSLSRGLGNSERRNLVEDQTVCIAPYLEVGDGVGGGEPACTRVLLVTERSVERLGYGAEVESTHSRSRDAVPVRKRGT